MRGDARRLHELGVNEGHVAADFAAMSGVVDERVGAQVWAVWVCGVGVCVSFDETRM